MRPLSTDTTVYQLCWTHCHCSVAVTGLLQYKAFLRLAELSRLRRRQTAGTEDLNLLIQTVSWLLNCFYSSAWVNMKFLSADQQLSSRESAHPKYHCLLHRVTRRQQVMRWRGLPCIICFNLAKLYVNDLTYVHALMKLPLLNGQMNYNCSLYVYVPQGQASIAMTKVSGFTVMNSNACVLTPALVRFQCWLQCCQMKKAA